MPSLIVTTDNPDLLFETAMAATASTGWAKDALPVGFIDPVAQEIAAVVVFQNRSGEHADLHIAAVNGHRLDAESLAVIVKLAFDPAHLNLDVLWAPIPVRNTKAQISALKMGFEFEARRRGYAADGSDAILMALRRDTVFTTPATATPALEGAPTGA